MLGASRGVAALRGGVANLRGSRLAVVMLVYAALVLDNMLLTVVVPIIPEYLYHLEHRHAPDSLNTTTITTSSLTATPSPLPDASSSSLELDENLTRQPLKVVGRWTLTPTHKTSARDRVTSIHFPSSIQAPRVNSEGDRSKYLSEHIDNEKRVAVDLSDSKTLRIPHRYWRIKNTHEILPQISDTLLRNERNILDVYPEELGSEYKTRDQQTVSANDMKRFVKSEHEQTLDGTLVKFSAAQKRVLPVPRRHDATEAPTFSEERKRTKTPEESKPSTSISPAAVGKREIFEDLSSENWKVGLLLSSKALVQLMVNPMVGSLTAHIGYSLPLVVGTHNLLLSAVLFASAQDFTLMFLGRSIQGVASACIAVSGMGIIAERFTDDGERGRVQGLVMGGIALGVLAGYPLGSLLYDFTDSKTPPFLVVAVLTVILGILQVVVLNPRPAPELVRDPYIVVTAGAIMVATSTLAVLEPCLPIWLIDNLHLQKWQLGVVFIPDSVGYFLGTSCTAGPSYRLGRWRVALLAMMLVALAAATVPEAGSLLALAGPHLFLGVGVGTVDAALMPLLAALVDARHVAAYGAVYAIAQAAVALAYFVGPLVGSAMVEVIGFPWLMRSMALLNLCYCPVLCFLGTLETTTSETQAILMAAPQPQDYLTHITTVVQPRQSSVTYQQLFDEDDD